MAETEQVETSVPSTLEQEEEDDEQSRLQTVQLNSDDQVPVLSFQHDDTNNGLSSSSTPPLTNPRVREPNASNATSRSVNAGSSEVTSSQKATIDGTQLQGRTAVTKSIVSTTNNFKEWSFQQYKVTKQVISERLGKSMKTVDSSLESRLEGIRDTQKKYQQLMSLSSQLQFYVQKVVETQKSLAEHFAFLSVRCPELDTEFEFNSETQKRVARNGETLVSSLQFFISNVYTVSAKSIEDTLSTAKQYDMARILYDAYRSDLENMTKAAKNSQAAANKLPAVQAEYDKQKEVYEKLRYDLDIKLKLLDENRFKVMQRQLLLLQSAFAAYFSGNNAAIEGLLKEFQDKMESKRQQRTDPPTWLEDLPDDSADTQ